MNSQFKRAIRQIGCIARLPNADNATFAASIQPLNLSGDGHSEIGLGKFSRYTFYAEVCGATAALAIGDTIEFDNRSYLIESIENQSFRGQTVYRQGVLILKQEADV